MVPMMPLHPKTPSSIASFKSTLFLTFWYWLSWKRGHQMGVVVVVVVVVLEDSILE